MTCKGCDVKETAATVDVEALIEEQLAIENDLAALEVIQSRIKIWFYNILCWWKIEGDFLLTLFSSFQLKKRLTFGKI